MRPIVATFLLLALGLLATPTGPARAENRHVAVIVDTSGSMQGNDPPRYTMQLSKILSDLLGEDDELTIVRMSHESSCAAGVSNALALRLDPSDRDAFKAALAQHTECDTGTHYSAAIRTAIDVLSLDSEKKRMLLMLADSGGLGGCEANLTRELLELRDSGATVAAVNIGLTAGAFDRNPAINFTTAARDAQELVEAVGLVYQRFLGAKRVQTGEVSGAIEVEIPLFSREAFLVVAADGPIQAMEEGLGNPGAQGIDLNFHGGGESLGRDGQRRGYRIVRLLHPKAGRWTFKALGLADRAGWMLLFDTSLAVRRVSPPTVAQGMKTPLEFEVYDEVTGTRVTDPTALAGLDVSVEQDGRKIELNDGGRDGDRKAGDGILTASLTFEETGRQELPVRLESDLLDSVFPVEVDVVEASWALDVRTPDRAEVSSPVDLRVELRPQGDLSRLVLPERIDAVTGGPTLGLRDDGTGADETAGDRIYSGTWTPSALGTVHVEYVPRGGQGAFPRVVPLEVVGSLKFAPPQPIDLGTTGSDSELAGELDLTRATVRGRFEVELSCDYDLDHTALEIDLGDGWEPLGERPRTLVLAEGGDLRWRLRLRVGSCPEPNLPDRRFEVRVKGLDAGSQPVEAVIPLAVEVVADPWWICWWPVIAAVLGTLIAGVVFHGYYSPSRFPPRLGVVLSPEEDLEEGFFHPIRAQRGSRSGFYRDARVYVTSDYRLSARAAGALARLRAEGQQVCIEPMAGTALWRQNLDGEWEQVPPGESRARIGVPYRNDLESVFFALRNG